MLEQRLHADPLRVVLRPSHLGWQGTGATARAEKLVSDVASLSENDAAEEYTRVLHDFEERHWQTEQMFLERYVEVEAMLGLDPKAYTTLRKRLIGAYFCHEYTYAAAALMNPSIVRHPDQSGISHGAVRFVGEQLLMPYAVSDRAVGFASTSVPNLLVMLQETP